MASYPPFFFNHKNASDSDWLGEMLVPCARIEDVAWLEFRSLLNATGFVMHGA